MFCFSRRKAKAFFAVLLTLGFFTPSSLLSEEVYGGLPRKDGFCCEVKVLENIGYTVGYSEKKKNPVWVVYSLASPQFKTAKRPSRFLTDGRTASRVSHSDYTRSGYDRGHMAPNRDIAAAYGGDAQIETFLMTNICPQSPALNRRVWKKLEEKIFKSAKEGDDIEVIAGPIFDNDKEFLPGTRVEIPDEFYKIIVIKREEGQKVLAFTIPQNVEGKERLDQFFVSIDEIEVKTGFDFFSDLEDELEEKLESSKDLSF